MDNKFNQFLMDNKEKYQGVTRAQFDEFYSQAKVHAKRIAQMIGLEVQSIDDDTSDVRLDAMINDGEVHEINGLYWRDDAIRDAREEYSFAHSENDSKLNDEEE